MTNVEAGTQSTAARGYSLHIGVNNFDAKHYGWDGELLACEADADAMLDIARTCGYHKSVILMTQEATREAVIANICSMSKVMNENDIFFISYAGHGGQLPDVNQDETDGTDETWCLYDAQLIDDELYDLWYGFPAGSRILIVSDSCHSGSVARAGVDGQIFQMSIEPDQRAGMERRPRAMPYRMASRTYRANREFYDKLLNKAGTREAKENLPVSVRLLSGCQDNQESLDGPFNGAFTTQLLKAWNGGEYKHDYDAFLKQIRLAMPETQTPNHYVVGAPNSAFDKQIPFAI